MTSPCSRPGRTLVGNVAGWHLSFHRAVTSGVASFPDPASCVLEVGSAEYHAEIRATLPDGMEGGSYEFIVEGLGDADYAQLAEIARPADGRDGEALFARLYLFWVDVNSGPASYLANVAGLSGVLGGDTWRDLGEHLVAVVRVIALSRRAEARRYETVITAREWIYDRVEGGVIRAAVEAPTLEGALEQLLTREAQLRPKKDFVFVGDRPNARCAPPGAPGTGAPKVVLEAGKRVADTLRDAGRRLERQTGRYGRGMLLLRDGKLHVGTRAIPYGGDAQPPAELTAASGFVAAESIESLATGGQPARRRQFRVTLKGRPDLKPGDVVCFEAPPGDEIPTQAGVFGAIGDLARGPLLPIVDAVDPKRAVELYVSSVQHRLGRTQGFVTTLTGVQVRAADGPDAPWDCVTPAPAAGRREEGSADGARVSPEAAVAHATRAIAVRAVATRSFAEVAEVRQMFVSGTGEPPGQTLVLWRGLAPGDYQAYAARRAPVERPSPAPATGAPYASPFAWGKCGLVLPRYPGTRVLVAHRAGSADDPVDVGALWESGTGPVSHPGDWWLILPAELPTSRRERADDGETPQPYTGRVTQDLIDADGNRVIEVGELTVRVGRGEHLRNAGERPQRGATADAITIEHAGGASIVIDQDGKVTITGRNIELDAGSGTITMKAKTVDVQVADAMNVH